MEKLIKNILLSIVVLLSIFLFWSSEANIFSDNYRSHNNDYLYYALQDTNPKDSVKLKYPFKDKNEYKADENEYNNPLYLKDPKNITEETEYDPLTNEFVIKSKVGGFDYRPNEYVPFSEYLNYDIEQSLKNYWKERAEAQSMSAEKGVLPKIHIGGEAFERIFGSSTIDIRPQGSAELLFGVTSSKREDPQLDVKQRRSTNFDFQEKIQMNVTAKIGDKIQLGVNYNTEASFDFENKMKLAYEGKEDEIIKLIEAGNVSLPLNNTLITGSQSLFGFKTKLQFGKVYVTSIFSEQKSKSETINVTGGAQVSTYNINADQYEENKHYLLAQYFKNNYDKSLTKLPLIMSNITITKIEVWVTTVGVAVTENRNIVAFSDLGEENKAYLNNSNKVFISGKYRSPNNFANNIYKEFAGKNEIRDLKQVSAYLKNQGYIPGQDFEKIENAKRLNSNEYSFNSKLGFISLNNTLNADQVLAVAFQYTIIGDTTTYQVGEFFNDIAAPNCLIVKLLKSTAVNTEIPLWNLMMKNVYSIGAYQVNKEDFRLNVLYTDDNIGVPTGFLNETKIEGIPLIKILGLDRLNSQLEARSDGIFDFIDGAASYGGTIQATNGRIFFPVLEPFGQTIRDSIDNKELADKYAYDELYRLTKNGAQQYPDKNKFALEGRYKSASGSEISLNAMNVPQGSVKVTSGGILLTENVDYTVDYTMGRVKIINEGIMNSGAPVQISLESNSLFSIQKKTLMGTRIDYAVKKDLNIGATILHLSERPLTQKINFGDEPISNTIWGIDINYQTDANIITKILDKLPLYNTKTPSKINFTGEFANLIPGHSKAIGKSGTSYIDDFEGSTSSYDLKTMGNWTLASTPQGQEEANMFPEAKLSDDLKYGYNRSKLAWYIIDPLFLRNNNLTPSHIKNDKNQQSNHFVREILETEVFPNKQSPNGQPTTLSVFNLSFYPSEKGPYNYDITGLNSDGTLNNPASRWGGIMRNMTTTDFETTNIEYIQFWVMDPFIYENGLNGQPLHSGGELYFNLGDISEDVLRDSRKSFENGLPISAEVKDVDTTVWGRVPSLQALVNSFDNNSESRQYQDVGLDGLGDNDEKSFFNLNYLEKIKAAYGENSAAYKNALSDPSTDNYRYFRGSAYDNDKISILNRYKEFNGMDGNSPTDEQSKENYPTAATNIPNIEDINKDNTLSEDERYFQYKIDLRPDKMNIGENYIADYLDASVKLKNGTSTTVRWYQFKIPIYDYTRKVGNIQDFKSIRFMRMFFKGFKEPIHCRFATLELIRTEWRKYNYSLLSPGEYLPTDDINNTDFSLSSVNIEENGKRKPIPYVLPPGIEREINLGTTNLQQLNEQSLAMKVCNLIDGDARAIYKTAELDVRKFKKIKMYVHGEAQNSTDILNKGDLTVFIRFGTDFINNYYEYEIPLTPTQFGSSNPYHIWPDDNDIEITLDDLINVKQERNLKMRDGNININLTTPYSKIVGSAKITVVGIPNLSLVKTIMLGVRNPKKKIISDSDDGLAKCAEIWFNEFRLSDFDEKGGYAALGRINTTLADLGNLAVSGSISTPGFGSIEQKINERQKETINQFDIATNLELGKFFPEKAGLRIPMHFDYGKVIKNPEFNPLNPDVKFKEDLETYKTQKEKDSIKSNAQDYTMRKNINFSNIKKVKTGTSAKPHIYDIENLDLTLAYSETYHRDIDIAYNTDKLYKAAIGYNFVANPKKIAPFEKNKILSKYKSLRLIKDFNFYFFPKLLTFQTNFDRQYNENLLRSKSTAIIKIDTTYIKTFNWNRLYALKYDITQNLRFDYNAQAAARVYEPEGRLDTYGKKEKQQLWDSIMDGGRINDFSQKVNLSYTIPINKIPIFDWISSNASYTGEYRWTAAAPAVENLGNTIENGNNKQLSFNANLVNLYNKIPYLKRINSGEQDNNKAPKKKITDDKNKSKKKPGSDKKKKTSAKSKDQNDEEGAEDELEEKPEINYAKLFTEGAIRMIMGIRTFSLTYSEIKGTAIPGFKPRPDAIGMNWNDDAPGLPFVFGSQKDIRTDAFRNNWITNDTNLNTAYLTKYSKTLSYRSNIELLPELKIDLSGNRTETYNTQSYLKYSDNSLGYDVFSPTETGTFSISWFILPTAFIKDNKDYSNTTFDKFTKSRYEIASSLAAKDSRWKGKFRKDSITGEIFPEGYGPTSVDVLIPAFLAAYTGKGAKKFSMDKLPQIPLPNWRLTYSGLSKLEFLSDYFESVTLGHSYQSLYTVGNYNTNLRYRPGIAVFDSLSGNFVTKYNIGQITITEQFSPLINLDMVFQNSLMAKAELRKSRNLSMSFANNQLTEVKSSEVIIGMGYRFKDVIFYMKGFTGGQKKKYQSDINLKADVSIRTNKSVLRKIVEGSNQISAGQRVISINTSADYQLSERFEIRFYFDKIITQPFISSQFPNSTTNGGLSLRFS
ncbi:MAG: cell surface protein SprA, partial [Bacteroidales bacterium]|nr:cell surface protein SprA [Bacteroidales bacterium]